MIRRIILLLSVAALMAAMMVVTALPAFAVSKAQCGIGAITSEGVAELFEPPTNTVGGAVSENAQFLKASGSNQGQSVAFEPPPATKCAKGNPTSPLD